MENPKKSYRNSGGRGRGRGGGRSGGGGEGEELHSAARSGDLIAVQTILSSNPLAINCRDKLSRTPLHLAAWSGQTQVVDYLCRNKADVGAAAMDDMSAIHFASQKGHLETVRTLISFGVSVKACTRKGLTPLHYAVLGSHVDLIKYLVRKGSNLSTKTKAGKTPLDLASSDEIRSIMSETEKSAKERDEKSGVKDKANHSNPQPDLQEMKDAMDNTNEVGVSTNVEDKRDELEKRKCEEDSSLNGDGSPEAKKAKISLNHLLSNDDGQNDDENL